MELLTAEFAASKRPVDTDGMTAAQPEPPEMPAAKPLAKRRWSTPCVLGLICSVCALLAVSVAGLIDSKTGVWVVFVQSGLSVPGVALSAFALLHDRQRPAIWGLVLGIIGIGFLPTMLLGFFLGM